jgi:hypothetical protein
MGGVVGRSRAVMWIGVVRYVRCQMGVCAIIDENKRISQRNFPIFKPCNIPYGISVMPTRELHNNKDRPLCQEKYE